RQGLRDAGSLSSRKGSGRQAGKGRWEPSTLGGKGLVQRFQLVDQAGNDTEANLPESGIAGVEAEGLQQFRMVLGAARLQHLEILLLEAALGLPVDRVERVHQAVAESVCIDVEGRVNEVRNIGPEGLVARSQPDGGAKAFGLHFQ